MSFNSGSLFSIFLLCKIIDIVYCIKMVFILLKECLMAFLRILKFSSMIFIERMCMNALAAITIMTISSFTFHPLLLKNLQIFEQSTILFSKSLLCNSPNLHKYLKCLNQYFYP